MRALTSGEKRTIRRAGILVGAYLLVFYGLKSWRFLEGKLKAHEERSSQADLLKLEFSREQVKAERLRKLRESSRIDLKRLEMEGVVGPASAAIQKAAQSQGIQLGPSREAPGRPAARELAMIQIEGQGTVLGVVQFLHSLGSLGFPLAIEGVHLKTAGMKPGQVHLSLSLALLDYKAWKSPEKSGV